MKLPDAIIVQNIAGHLRIKIPSKKNDSDYFKMVQQVFNACQGVKSIRVNPINASVVFKYNGDLDSIKEFAQTHMLFNITSTSPPKTPLMQIFDMGVTKVDDFLGLLSFGQLDIRTIAFIMFVAIGIYQIIRGNFVLPSWYTAFWYASNILNSEKGKL